MLDRHAFKPTWVRPGLVACEDCGMTEDRDYANRDWVWTPAIDRWRCPDCEDDREHRASA